MSSIDSLHGIKVGTTIDYEGEPYVVVSANFMRCQQRKPVMQTKMKNLINGKVIEYSFKPGDKIESANLDRVTANYLYTEGNECYFMDNESFEQFSLEASALGNMTSFLIEGRDVDLLKFNGKPVSVELPKKVELKVTEAAPGIKGDSSQGATKQITLETGAQMQAPLFIKEGDIIRVNTETGEYVERV
ncbi:MAG TPA: elongation factor P [Candidatus Bipolaricaulota bacterium]|nr:elongation factor P [Candidatus Bipolaricaulota bacterium]